MNARERFFDTNVLLYLFSNDSAKAERAEELVSEGGTVNVQVLNEFASVAIRKARLPVSDVRESLAIIRQICRVEVLDVLTHELGLQLIERHLFSFYDALIVAAALRAGCKILYTEDMQHERVVDGLRIRNPFRA